MFRDESSLSANPHLWSSITSALDSAEWFVLLLSPEAGSSPWVNREVEYWLAHKDPGRILPVLTEGEFVWDESVNRLDPARTTVAPPALLAAFAEEPRWVDLRWAREDTDLDLRNSRFRGAVADVASAIRGVPKDDLESEEVRQHRRTVRTAWGAGVALAVLTVAAGGAAFYANDQRREAATQRSVAEEQALVAQANEARAEESQELAEQSAREAEAQRKVAEDQARRAQSRGLAAQSVGLARTRIDVALLLAVQGVETLQSPETLDGLFSVLNSAKGLIGFRSDMSHHLASYPQEAATTRYQVATASDDGRVVAVGGSDGYVYAYESANWSRLGPRLDAGIGPMDNNQSDLYATSWISLSGSGSRIAFSNPSGVYILELPSGRQLGMIPTAGFSSPPSVELSPDGSMVVIANRPSNPSLEASVWSVESEAMVGSFSLGGEFGSGDGTVAFSADGRQVVLAADDRIDIVDIATGSRRLSRVFDQSIWGAAISPDGRHIALAITNPLQVLILDHGSLETIGSVDSIPLDELQGMAFTPDGSYLSLHSEEGSAVVVDVTKSRLLATIGLGSGFPVATMWSGDRRLVAASRHGLSEWDVGVTSALEAESELPTNVHTLAADRNGALVALTQSGSIASSGPNATNFSLECSPDLSGSIAVDQQGSIASAVCRDQAGRQIVVVADLMNSAVLTRIVPSADVAAFTVSPSGDYVIVAQVDSTIVVYDSVTGNLTKSFSGPLVTTSVIWLPDESTVVMAGWGLGGEDLMFYDTETWENSGAIKLGETADAYWNQTRPIVTNLTHGPMGRVLYASRSDGVVWFIDPAERKVVTQSTAGRPPYAAIAVSPDGAFVAALSESADLLLWDANTGVPLNPGIRWPRASGLDLAWTTGGIYVAAIESNQATLTRWAVNPDQMMTSACELAGRNMTQEEWAHYLPGVSYDLTCDQFPPGL